MRARPNHKLRRRLASALSLLSTLVLGTCLSRAQSLSIVQGTAVDKQGLAVPAVEIQLKDASSGVRILGSTDASGVYRIAGIPPGTYTMVVSKAGFAPQSFSNLELAPGRTVTWNIVLQVGPRMEHVQVTSQAPLLSGVTSATETMLTSEEINALPLPGPNFVDLLQLVPGSALNRQNDPASDKAVPILGERSGNAVFLIDGLPNGDEVNGGVAAQLNPESILEFQVIAAGYAAEFGHGSGGIVNVITRSGANAWHGGGTVLYRNDALDSSDIPDRAAPFLSRWDFGARLGGALIPDKVFFFTSAERIQESRELNFQLPPNTPTTLGDHESAIAQPSATHETRFHAKLDEQWARHQISQQMNLTNHHLTNFIPLAQAFRLPSTASDTDGSNWMVGLGDAATLGNQGNPLLLTAYGQYRRDTDLLHPSHPELGPATSLIDLFSSLTTGTLFGDLGAVQVNPGYTPLDLKQEYASFGVSLAKRSGRHTWKAGGNFERTVVNGTEANSMFSQVLATASDVSQFAPNDAGLHFLTVQGNTDPNALRIHLRNNYVGLFVQDDFRVRPSVTLNLGLRWDDDSQFPNTTNFSPRLGVAWSITPRTVARASFGIFYDHFRLGIARDVPEFGGASILAIQYLSLPRLLYGNPTQSLNRRAARGLGTPCVSNNLTDAQIAAMGLTCPIKLPNGSVPPYYGVDHLNSVVAPGHAPIPPDSVVNLGNVASLTGLTGQEFADMASQAIGQAPGFFLFDPLGNLSSTKASDLPIATRRPITVDPQFRTPYTRGFSLGVQRELSSNLVLALDYDHKDIRHMLGLRNANVAFEARLPGHLLQLVPGTGSEIIQSYGPWFEGTYDALVVGLTKRTSKRVTFAANYTWTRAVDDDLNASFTSNAQTAGVPNALLLTGPTDSFVGRVPVVTDPSTGKTNAQGSFVTGSGDPNNLGNFVPEAGRSYNGANLDKGPSDLAFTHSLLIQGTVRLPWEMEVSNVFRAQSGFHYSAFFSGSGSDTDGDNLFNGVDWTKGRNRFTVPPFVNMDLRITKRFSFGDKELALHFEMFNLFNRANPAAVQQQPGQDTPFGTVLQVLPGRESQMGVRFSF